MLQTQRHALCSQHHSSSQVHSNQETNQDLGQCGQKGQYLLIQNFVLKAKKNTYTHFVSFTRIFHTLYVDFSYLYLSLLQCKQRFEKLKDVTDLQEKCRKLREQLEM